MLDPTCPLRKVHTVISDENVWVNIQKTDYPLLMSFDLTNTKHWEPFLDEKKRKTSALLEGTKEERTIQP